MRIRWRGLELPSRVIRDHNISSDTYGRFHVEPFERGFGTTVGNSLRRILLSSLEGAAVTHIRIKGADHEFSSIKGVVEDVVDIILNIKGLVVKSDSDEPKTMRLSVSKAGPITGGMIETDPSITVVNKDHVIATLTEDLPFEVEFTVGKGRGYRTANENSVESEGAQDLGVINVDSIFSPVTRVRYATEDARVGQKTDYDRLILEIWTNGTINAEMALVEAAKILRKHLNPFVQYFELGNDLVTEDAMETLREAARPTIDPDLEHKLNMTVQELDLSVRANNCLESAKITVVRDLVQKTDGDLLKVRSFGKTSLREVKRRLADLGLSLGMDLDALAAGQAVQQYTAEDLEGDDDEDEDEEALDGAEETADEQK
ncbi:MAG TPA: DNA-directed RNA polymerase subunit alpha [Tepidisphaeraceae bacterium]|jgi:DNA-directed RNA polymerase subunit alpha